MKKLFALLFLPIFIFSSQTFIKERLINADRGDYILYEKQKNQHLLYVNSIKDHKVILEEMSYGKKKLKNGVKHWLKHSKPVFASHNIIEIDLKSGKILECYSFTQKRFIDISKQECFILNLIELDFKPVTKDNQRKIGPAPHEGLDRRKTWSPPHIIDAKQVKCNFKVLSATWPADDTSLAGKKIETYFDEKHPFAYWIEIKDNSGLALRVSCKDSGKNLTTKARKMPRRRPQVINSLVKHKEKLSFKILCPPYYEDFKLYAHNIHSDFCTPYEVNFTTEYNDKQNILKIDINKKDLKKILEPNQTYSFEFHILSPIYCRLEALDSFTLND